MAVSRKSSNEQKKTSFTHFLAKNWKIIAFIIALSIFFNAQGCMCGSDADDSGNEDEGAEDQMTQALGILTQISSSLCANSEINILGLCGDTSGVTDLCEACPSGSDGDVCRQQCNQMTAPQLSGTKLIKGEGSFIYSHDITMVVLKDTVYNAYYKDSSGARNEITSCAGSVLANSAMHCTASNIESANDNIQICLDYFVDKEAFNKCADLTVDNAPTASPLTPAGGQMISPGEYSIRQNELFVLPISASDPDCPSGCFRFTYTSEPPLSPERFTLNSVLGEIRFTPNQQDVGDYAITVTITDTEQNTNTFNVILHVIDVNDAPEINIPSITMQEDQAYSFNIKDYTIDVDPADTQAWAYTVPAPNKLTASIGSEGIVTITPEKDWNGNHKIKFTATDSRGLSGSQEVNVTVSAVTDAPYINPPIPAIRIDEDFEKNTTSLASYKHDDDDSGVNLVWTVANFEEGMISAYVENTDSLVIGSIENANGDTVISLELTDTDGNKVSYDLPVKINPKNDAPVLANIPEITITEGETFVLELNNYVSDPDQTNDQLRWAVRSLAPELRATYDYTTQTIALRANPGYVGTSKQVEVIVTDFIVTRSMFFDVNIA